MVSGEKKKRINAFLIECCQVVKLNNAEFKPAPGLSGIPRRSMLGPVLSVIYINELSGTVNCDILLFADDTKIMRTIRTREDASRGLQLTATLFTH